jgi:uncharacterized protein (DUF305 family)
MSRVAVLSVVVSIVVVGCSDRSDPAGPGIPQFSNNAGVASAPAPNASTARYEIKFMEDMIDHHMMAVMTAEVCVQNAVHEELRSLCEQIIGTQSQEIETMQQWLSDWYGVTYEPQMKPGDQKMVDRLASLSGSDFEIAFMEMMIQHHEGAIKAAEGCLKKAYHTELLELCEGIIEAQQAEIEQMETWLCEWYSICD